MPPKQPTTPERLAEARERFIATWGQMAAAWGISRTMAEVHALLFIMGEPMCTDDIIEHLGISRGSASMSLRALLDWGLLSRSHKRGDRREYFQAEQDVWVMARAIVRNRLQREIEPVMASLFEVRDLTGAEAGKETAAAEHNARLDELIALLETMDKLAERFVRPSGRGLRLAATMLNKVS
jgi:HTH-type transcriptional regulator, glycine betaine synthesis regulator